MLSASKTKCVKHGLSLLLRSHIGFNFNLCFQDIRPKIQKLSKGLRTPIWQFVRIKCSTNTLQNMDFSFFRNYFQKNKLTKNSKKAIFKIFRRENLSRNIDIGTKSYNLIHGSFSVNLYQIQASCRTRCQDKRRHNDKCYRSTKVSSMFKTHSQKQSKKCRIATQTK